MLSEWMRRHLRVITPAALFLFSLMLLSYGSYSRHDLTPSFFSRTLIDIAGLGQRGIAGAGGGMKSLSHRYLWLVGVEEENRRLRRELDDSRRQNYFLREQALENDRLRRLLNFRPKEVIKTWIPAQVIAHNLSGLNRTITIDKGARDGIRPRMAVIAYDSALVGQILDEPGSAIAAHTCQVLLISDRRSRVDVAVQRPESRAKGILAGRPESNDLELLYMERLADIRKGDLLISSGYGGVFRKGWPVGLVTEIRHEPNLFYPRVLVEPVADFSRLEEVMAIMPAAEER